jgi:hypothetical protein
LVTLLHPPYTAWNLSYVAIGSALAPHLHAVRLIAALVAFFLAVGISAHALDELNGRPLDLALGRRSLIALATVGLLGAAAIGVVGAVTVSLTLIPFVCAGVFLVLAYDLGWFSNRFHNDAWFAIAWGAFPAATGYWVNALTLRAPGVFAVAACCALSVAQRRLSTPVRELRRRTLEVSGEQRLRDGRVIRLDVQRLAAPLDGGLAACALAITLFALAVVLARLQ